MSDRLFNRGDGAGEKILRRALPASHRCAAVKSAIEISRRLLILIVSRRNNAAADCPT
jgi:hypothetical protein